MQSIVEEALKYTEREREQRNSYSPASTYDDFDEITPPQIKIIGCGGAGNNTINRLFAIGVEGAEMIAINTDKQHLDIISADKKILIGKNLTRGLGAGGVPDKGRRAAEMARRTLKDILKDTDLVFITAGMGGGTGTGSVPVVAEIAKECGAIVIGMVSTPFRVERHRLRQAETGLEKMRKHCHTSVVLDNNRLLSYAPNLPLEQSFSVMDQLIASTVKGISETKAVAYQPGLRGRAVRNGLRGCGRDARRRNKQPGTRGLCCQRMPEPPIDGRGLQGGDRCADTHHRWLGPDAFRGREDSVLFNIRTGQ